MKHYLFTLLPVALLAAAFWTNRPTELNAQTLTDREAAEIWRSECAACHGTDGRGQTRAGRRAGVKDFTDPEYQRSWTDAEAVQVIRTATKDGRRLRNKNPYADELTDAEIRALVAYVRGFAR